MRYDEAIAGRQMEETERGGGAEPGFAPSRFAGAHYPPGRAIFNRSAQLDFRLNSGADIDPEDQVRGRRGLVVRRNPVTGARQLDELIWGLLPRGTKNRWTAPRPIKARAETVADHPMFCRRVPPTPGDRPGRCVLSAPHKGRLGVVCNIPQGRPADGDRWSLGTI